MVTGPAPMVLGEALDAPTRLAMDHALITSVPSVAVSTMLIGQSTMSSTSTKTLKRVLARLRDYDHFRYIQQPLALYNYPPPPQPITIYLAFRSPGSNCR